MIGVDAEDVHERLQSAGVGAQAYRRALRRPEDGPHRQRRGHDDRSPAGSEPAIARAIVERPALAPVLYAMWGRAEGQRLGRNRVIAGPTPVSPCSVLKGPELQQRLYGTPWAAYHSSDVDVLVLNRKETRGALGEVMQRDGWVFEPRERSALASVGGRLVRPGRVPRSTCTGGSTQPTSRHLAMRTTRAIVFGRERRATRRAS